MFLRANGLGNPPTGTIQFPGLLDAYGVNRNPHKVPGVDYYVGCPSDVTLRSPLDLTGTPDSDGVSRSSNRVIIAAGGTLDRYDFRLGGLEWYIQQSGDNVTIDRCYISANAGTPNNAIVNRAENQRGFTFKRTTFDGLQTGGSYDSTRNITGIGNASAIDTVIEFCEFKNINQHHVQTAAGRFDCRRSLFRGVNYGGGVHADFIRQSDGAKCTSLVLQDCLFYNEPGNGLGINAFAVSIYPSCPLAWAGGTTYSASSIINYGGRAWRSLQAGNTGNTPGDWSAWWREIFCEVRNCDMQFNTFVSVPTSPDVSSNYAVTAALRSTANGSNDTDYIGGDISNNYFDLRSAGGAWTGLTPTQTPHLGVQAITYGAKGANINMLDGSTVTTT